MVESVLVACPNDMSTGSLCMIPCPDCCMTEISATSNHTVNKCNTQPIISIHELVRKSLMDTK